MQHVFLPMPTKPFDGIITYITVIIALCVIHLVIYVTRTTALGSLFGGAWLLLVGLMADR